MNPGEQPDTDMFSYVVYAVVPCGAATPEDAVREAVKFLDKYRKEVTYVVERTTTNERFRISAATLKLQK